MLASHNAVSFDFFSVHEIRNNICKNDTSVTSSFLYNCFEIVQA